MFWSLSEKKNGPLASAGLNKPVPRQCGVLLVNVGTPTAPDVASVRQYLVEFLSDPLVIHLPWGMQWFQRTLARLIAWRRAPHSAEKYQQIWTERGSPLRKIMEDQAAALAEKLPQGWRVFLGMRYGTPGIAEALREIAALGIEELVIVPLYPQFSRTSTGTVVQEVYRALREAGSHINVTARTTWYDDVGYINAQAHLLADYAASEGLHPINTFLLFSAHGLPISYIRDGDPYADQVKQTVRLVTERLGWPPARSSTAYQSRMGPAEWLKPDVPTALRELAARAEHQVLVCPISFAADSLETLEEIDIRYRKDFATVRGKLFLCPALNTSERFITSLKNLVIHGPQSVSSQSRKTQPLITPPFSKEQPEDAGLERLVMLGASLPSRIGVGRGPRLVFSEQSGLACAKRPHNEVRAFLQSLTADGLVDEALVWNTCQRFECYAWLKPGDNGAAQDCVVTRLRKKLFPDEPQELQINVLFGTHAWHHLMRTITGLNSNLPGDKDIVEQFQTAYQLAERCKIAGRHSRCLVNKTIDLAEAVRKETVWGRLDPGYCYAAISRVQDSFPHRPANCRHVVIGGSSTSRSILQTLYQRFGVKESDVTLVYRNHQGGQMKLLRKAVGRGRRLRTHSYSDQAVLEAIADADVVYFGIDRDTPVLDAEALHGLRDFKQRPLTIIDFNMSGSTELHEKLEGIQLWNAAQLDAEVDIYAQTMCANEDFPRAVREAETWIEQHAPEPITECAGLPCLCPSTTACSACTESGNMLKPVLTRSNN